MESQVAININTGQKGMIDRFILVEKKKKKKTRHREIYDLPASGDVQSSSSPRCPHQASFPLKCYKPGLVAFLFIWDYRDMKPNPLSFTK